MSALPCAWSMHCADRVVGERWRPGDHGRLPGWTRVCRAHYAAALPMERRNLEGILDGKVS